MSAGTGRVEGPAPRPADLEAIKARLTAAGYPHPKSGTPSPTVRDISREAQEARARLREHIIEDVWALLDEVEALRRQART